MVKVILDKLFKNKFLKIKDPLLKLKIKKQIAKIIRNPKTGKPMRNLRKGTRELYVKPSRLAYEYLENKDIVNILDIYHKKHQ